MWLRQQPLTERLCARLSRPRCGTRAAVFHNVPHSRRALRTARQSPVWQTPRDCYTVSSLSHTRVAPPGTPAVPRPAALSAPRCPQPGSTRTSGTRFGPHAVAWAQRHLEGRAARGLPCPSRKSQRGPWGSSEGHRPPCPQGASCCRGGGHTVPTPASHSGGQGLTPQFNAQRRVVRGQATEVHASHPRRLTSVSDRGPWPAGGAHAQHRARRPSRANAPPTPRPAPGLEESAAPGAHWPLRPAGPAKRVRSR